MIDLKANIKKIDPEKWYSYAETAELLGRDTRESIKYLVTHKRIKSQYVRVVGWTKLYKKRAIQWQWIIEFINEVIW